MAGVDKRLATIKKASEVIGASESFLRDLLSEGILTTYKIKSATYLSLREFEEIAKPIVKKKIEA